MLPTQRSIALISTELNLFTLSDHITVQYPGIEVRSLAAPAYRFDLLYIVSQLHEPLSPRKQFMTVIP